MSRKKGLDGADILKDLMKPTDKPRVIGKPGPTAAQLRELLERLDAERRVEEECSVLNAQIFGEKKN